MLQKYERDVLSPSELVRLISAGMISCFVVCVSGTPFWARRVCALTASRLLVDARPQICRPPHVFSGRGCERADHEPETGSHALAPGMLTRFSVRCVKSIDFTAPGRGTPLRGDTNVPLT
jgi:hypothetical protein